MKIVYRRFLALFLCGVFTALLCAMMNFINNSKPSMDSSYNNSNVVTENCAIDDIVDKTLSNIETTGTLENNVVICYMIGISFVCGMMVVLITQDDIADEE